MVLGNRKDILELDELPDENLRDQANEVRKEDGKEVA
jgi:hypothetical protein